MMSGDKTEPEIGLCLIIRQILTSVFYHINVCNFQIPSIRI